MQQIQKKIKPCLLSFLGSGIPETEYVALKEIIYLIEKYSTQEYRREIRKFYVKESDPTYNKLCKIQLMQINCCK